MFCNVCTYTYFIISRKQKHSRTLRVLEIKQDKLVENILSPKNVTWLFIGKNNTAKLVLCQYKSKQSFATAIWIFCARLSLSVATLNLCYIKSRECLLTGVSQWSCIICAFVVKVRKSPTHPPPFTATVVSQRVIMR